MGSKEKFYAHVTALNPEVTGSCLPVDVPTINGVKDDFLVDCGIFQEQEYSDLNYTDFPFDCQKIKFVLITHNHADHIGRLPLLFKYGFNGKVYATESTSRLMRISLENSYQIMKEEAKLKKSKLLYEIEDVERVFENVEACKINETVQITPNIRATFFDNGHIIGAAMILVQISKPEEEDINLFFTGDYKSYNMFKKVKPIPDWVLELPMNVIIEATYGDTETSEIVYNFEDDIVEILNNGLSILISILGQGRAQEMLYCLYLLQKRGRISKDIHISLDGKLAHGFTHIYKSGLLEIDEDKLEFLPENFSFTTKESRPFVMSSTEQQIVLTTSGMLDHGPAQLYLPHVITNDKWAIFLTSYCSEGTLGRKLIDNDIRNGCIRSMGEELEVKAKIYSTTQFSSHAKADELIELLSKFKDLKLVMINHGQKDVKEKFAWRVENANISKRVEILGQHTIRVSHYGFVKSMGAKLYSVKHKKVKDKKSSKYKKVKAGRIKEKQITCRRKSRYSRR